jgi:3-phenylpropionate/trans-cinnamate dioxygenase ferredoxin reductase subunit
MTLAEPAETALGARVVIIGAGHAGGSAAAFLRQYGHRGPITLIGEEPLAPYQRPPLSKAWLKGEADGDSLLLKPLSWYEENSVSLVLHTTAAAIDRAAKMVTTGAGQTLPYDHLILATGARARLLPIPGADRNGVHSLRTAADAAALKRLLGPGRRLAVIGGGYVGLEVAASARTLGADVTIIEREPRILARVACAPLSSFFHAYHAARGVNFLCGAEIQAIDGGETVEAVALADARRIACDVALIGVGAIPNDDIAQAAGLTCADGIVVDQEARTSDSSIFAIGDVTRRPVPLYGIQTRLESVPSALEQAKQAAAAIVGRAPPAAEVPWFWSDQYELKLQIAGLPHDADQQVIRGDVADAAFAVFHLKGDVIQAVEAVNAPAAFMGARSLIGARAPVSISRLVDPDISMKAVAA